MPIANVWDATANGNQGAWVPAIIGVQGYQGAQGPQGYQGSQGVQGYISPLTTKGDIFTYSTSGTRLPVGNEGESLTVIPASGTGVSYFPAQVNIQKLTIGGHSYTDNFSGYQDQDTTGVGTTVTGHYYNTSQSTYNHIVSALDFDSGNVNYIGNAGTTLQHDLSLNGLANGLGGWVRVLRALTPSRARAPYTNDNGLCIGIWGINDMGLSSPIYTGTTFLPPFIDALRTTISRFRASTTSKDILTVPRTVTSNQVNTGTSYQAFQSSDNFNIVLPSDYDGSTVALNFIGGGSGTLGGTVTIVDSHGDSFKINGAATNQFTTSGYGITYTQGNPPNYPRVGQVARISGLASGVSHTLSCTVTSVNTAGATVDFDSWQIEGSFPNPVIIANIANIASSNSDYASLQAWNTAISGVVNEFPQPITVANIQDLLYQPSNNINRLAPYDSIHPSELGGIYIAEEIRKSYTRMSVPLRSFISSSSNNIKSGLAQYPLANFRPSRDHGSSTIKAIALGQTGLTPLGTWTINASKINVFTAQGLAPRNQTTYFVPVKVVEPCTISQFTCVSTTGFNGTIGFGLYYDWLGMPANLIYDAGTTSANITGDKSISITPQIKISTPGIYWIAMYLQGTGGAATNMLVGAMTGADPLIVNFDSDGAPLGACLYTSAPSYGSPLPGSALGAFNTSFSVSAWSPQVYMTLTGNY